MDYFQKLIYSFVLIVQFTKIFIKAEFPQDDDSISWETINLSIAPTWQDFVNKIEQNLDNSVGYEFTENIEYSATAGPISLAGHSLYMKADSGVTVTINVPPQENLFLIANNAYLGIEGNFKFKGQNTESSTPLGPNILFNALGGTLSVDGITIENFVNTVGGYQAYIAPVLLGVDVTGIFSNMNFISNSGYEASCMYITMANYISFNNVVVSDCSVSQGSGAQINIYSSTVSGTGNIDYENNSGSNSICNACEYASGASGSDSGKIAAIVVPLVLLFICGLGAAGYYVNRQNMLKKKKERQLLNESVNVDLQSRTSYNQF